MFAGSGPKPSPHDEDWLALKDAVKRFENAWQQETRPAIYASSRVTGPR